MRSRLVNINQREGEGEWDHHYTESRVDAQQNQSRYNPLKRWHKYCTSIGREQYNNALRIPGHKFVVVEVGDKTVRILNVHTQLQSHERLIIYWWRNNKNTKVNKLTKSLPTCHQFIEIPPCYEVGYGLVSSNHYFVAIIIIINNGQ